MFSEMFEARRCIYDYESTLVIFFIFFVRKEMFRATEIPLSQRINICVRRPRHTYRQPIFGAINERATKKSLDNKSSTLLTPKPQSQSQNIRN